MADYSSQDTGGNSIGIWIGVAGVIAIVLFVLFAGGNVTTTTPVDDLAADPALTAPVEETAPAAPAAPVTE